MPYRARLFVDFWNFQLSWNDRSAGRRCDWPRLPSAIVQRASGLLRASGLSEAIELDETLVYASVDPLGDGPLRGWLSNFLDRQPSFRVSVRERATYQARVRCRSCGAEIGECGACGSRLVRAVEKGIDAAIVTDLLSLAWQGAMDIGVLLSSDADFIPAVQRIQERGLKIINASWSQRGHDLKRTCWASFDLDDLVEELCRGT